MSLRGWALAEQGQSEAGIAQLRQGIADAQAAGTGVHQPHHLALLAEAHGKAGQAEEGLAVIAEDLRLVEENDERYYEAEVYRIKGTLILQSSVQDPGARVKEGEECFLNAIEIAQRQYAKSLELRAATSLARLWQHQGKPMEARELLAPVYDWFTEGFDTADLKDAKALLTELPERH